MTTESTTATSATILEPNTIRDYEKIALRIFGLATASLALSIGICFTPFNNFVPLFPFYVASVISMPCLFIFGLVNTYRLTYDHANFRSKRGALTLGIIAGSVLNVLVAIAFLVITFLAGLANAMH